MTNTTLIQTNMLSSEHQTFKFIKETLLKPLVCFVLLFSLHSLYRFTSPYLSKYIPHYTLVDSIEFYGYWIIALGLVYWFLVRSINLSTQLLLNSSLFSNHIALRVLVPFVSTIIKTIFCLTLIDLIFQYAAVSAATAYFVSKASGVLIIAAIAWILIKLLDVVAVLMLNHYQTKTAGVNTVRKVNTQIFILKRLMMGLIVLLAVGSALMLFENVRSLGASVLTTAGIAGLVFTFAAQRSLTSIFGGLEIALSQPIKIGDLIMIENESGTVEEINFRSVIIKLWDLRRLSVPTSYFLEKPFQNWSRKETNNLIGSITLFVDFTLPLEKFRSQVEIFLKENPLWDQKTGKIQVYDLQEQVMQIRILASAANADDLSTLKCEIREKVISYIVNHYPECLPSTRTQNVSTSQEGQSKEKSMMDEVFNTSKEEISLEK